MQWLKEPGFSVGEYVEVKCEGNSIILIKTNPPETKESLEDKLKSLDKTKRKKPLEMI